MIIQVSDLLKNYVNEIKVEGDITIDNMQFLGEDFIFLTPFSVKGRLVNQVNVLAFDAVCTTNIRTRCGRCTKELEQTLNFEIHENLAQETEDASIDEDVILFSGYQIDIAQLVQDGFLLNVSGRYLCSEDCKGLCEACGVDLNIADCDCSQTKIDPRWASLAKIMKDSSDAD